MSSVNGILSSFGWGIIKTADRLEDERRLSDLAAECSTLRAGYNALRAECSALQAERDALRIEREVILDERENYRLKWDQAQREHSRLNNHFEIAKSTLEDRETILSFSGKSKSQFGQDLFALSMLGLKRGGFFVEFGATNGVDLSNTYLLEKEFQWTGILAEPAICWHEELKANRNSQLDFSCVWHRSGEVLAFNETASPELSTLNVFSDHDFLSEMRRKGQIYEVSTISLGDLLSKHGAPDRIDYLSIDTEGSEFEILSNFDFSKYRISVITCEHNFTPNREGIFQLLTKKGFVRVREDISGVDDWYVNRSNF